MENRKFDWSKPLLVELEKATYTAGEVKGYDCGNGTGDAVLCHVGGAAGPGTPQTCNGGIQVKLNT
jgi:hypothetical protein